MKMVVCFDTEDDKGMNNAIKMIDHLAKEYKGRRVRNHDEVHFGKIEFIKMVRLFATEVAKEQGLESPGLLEGRHREKETWEGLRFAKLFADKIFDEKRMGRKIGHSTFKLQV